MIVTPRFAEKHDYKYNITDKYGVDPTDMEHLVLPAAPGLGKNPGAEHYGAGGVAEGMAGAGAGEDKYDKYQAPDMSHLHPNLDHLHSRYSLSEVELATNLRRSFTITEKAPTRAFSWLKKAKRSTIQCNLDTGTKIINDGRL